ncbi:MAG: hypothetical protein R3F37_22955 [Candidatus Competibacteraceae bacterium]
MLSGQLQGMPQGTPQGQDAAVSQDAPGGAAGAALIEVMTVGAASAGTTATGSRPRAASTGRKPGLPTLLEVEQAAWRELETVATGTGTTESRATQADKAVALLILLVALLAFAVAVARCDLRYRSNACELNREKRRAE